MVDRFLADLETLEASKPRVERSAVLMLRGASAEALAELDRQLVDAAAARSTTGHDRASELFGVAGVAARATPALRRAADRQLGRGRGQAGPGPGGLRHGSSATPRSTWSPTRPGGAGPSARDLPTRSSGSAVVATVRSAGADADRLGDELFARRARLLDANPDLRDALSDQTRQRRRTAAALLDGLLDGKVAAGDGWPWSSRRSAAAAGSVDAALRRSTSTSPPRRSRRRVATVRTAQRAQPTASSERLAAALSSSTARTVQLHVVVDPDLIGGMRVEIGDDVIDGTVSSRLDDARRRLAG